MSKTVKGRAAANPLHAERDKADKAASQHDSDFQRWSYGVIEKVSINNRVQIRLLASAGVKGELASNGSFLAITNEITDVVMRWGALRPGMLVRLHWTGESPKTPRKMIAEVIAATDDGLLNPENIENKLKTGPWKIFLSGV